MQGCQETVDALQAAADDAAQQAATAAAVSAYEASAATLSTAVATAVTAMEALISATLTHDSTVIAAMARVVTPPGFRPLRPGPQDLLAVVNVLAAQATRQPTGHLYPNVVLEPWLPLLPAGS